MVFASSIVHLLHAMTPAPPFVPAQAGTQGHWLRLFDLPPWVPACAPGHAHMLRRERKCSVRGVKIGAPAFPPPMWGRDREGGTTSTAVVFNPIPDKRRFKAPDFQNLRAEAAS